MSPNDLIRRRLPKTIDRETFVPAYLTLVASAHVWGGSRIYQDRYGITSPDFAILSTLSNHPGVQASDVADIVALDKSVVSRRLKRLTDRSLVASEKDNSRRRLYLTREGAAVHDAVFPLAMERERRMLAGFSEAEIDQLHNFLRRMFENIPLMNRMDDEAAGYDLAGSAGRQTDNEGPRQD